MNLPRADSAATQRDPPRAPPSGSPTAGPQTTASSDPPRDESAGPPPPARLACADAALLLLDTEGRVLAGEARGRELLGASEDGLGDLLVQHGDEPPRPLRQVLSSAARNRSAGPLLLSCAAGSGQRAATRLEVLPVPGARERFVVSVHDPRARAVLESALQHASQLRQLEAGARRLLHDLRTPLNAISLNLQLLQEAVAGTAPESERRPERQLATLDTVRRELERLDRSLDEFVARTRPARGGSRRFDVQRLLGDVARLQRAALRRAGVRLVREDETEKVEVQGSRDRLEQALLELVANALEALPEGGTLTLAARRRNDLAVIEVRDDGRGLPPADVARAFELHHTTKDHDGGIGLFVARTIVQSMGGELQLESFHQRGTTARLLLPLAGGEVDA